ncbi:MAG TPA: hypothetical protein VNK24_00975 [Elusimicrobiota bacterium]|nr:hypothetical protein [Elusimicrobiota bacterium]
MKAYVLALLAAAALTAPVCARNSQDVGSAFGQAGQIAVNYSAAQKKEVAAKTKAAQEAAIDIIKTARALEGQLASGGLLDSEGMENFYTQIKQQVLDPYNNVYQPSAAAAGAPPAVNQAVQNSIKALGKAYLREAPTGAINKVENIECDDSSDSRDDCAYLQRLEDDGAISSDDVMNESLSRVEKGGGQSQNQAPSSAAAPAAAPLPAGCSQTLYENCKAAGVDNFECQPCASVLGN